MGNFFTGDLEYRLYDIDGIILASPGDFIEINEPSGFSDINITLERDTDTDGVFFEFGGENEPLGFDKVLLSGQLQNPFDLVKGVFDSQGIDGNLRLDVLRESVVQYSGELDLETYDLTDIQITVNVRRVTIGDVFRTRQDVEVDFTTTSSIDGNPITPPTDQEMFLHSKKIEYGQRSTSNRSNCDFFIFDNDGWILQFDLLSDNNGFDGPIVNYDNQLNRSFGGNASTQLYNSVDGLTESNYIFKDVKGLLEISGRRVYRLVVSGSVATGGEHLGVFINVNGVINK